MDTIRLLCEQGNFEEATTRIIHKHGSDIFGFQMTIIRDDNDIDDVFAVFCSDLWTGIQGFRWQAALKTWLYTLARNAAYRFQSRSKQLNHEHVTFSNNVFLSGLITDARKSTTLWRTSSARRNLDLLREHLEPDDRALLILHVDQRMTWREVAQVVFDAIDVSDDKAQQELKRRAATLRQRFKRIKTRLKDLALEEGLIE